jgi:hypothetical protein
VREIAESGSKTTREISPVVRTDRRCRRVPFRTTRPVVAFSFSLLDGCGMYEAALNGRVLARSDRAVVPEGNIRSPMGFGKAQPARSEQVAITAA